MKNASRCMFFGEMQMNDSASPAPPFDGKPKCTQENDPKRNAEAGRERERERERGNVILRITSRLSWSLGVASEVGAVHRRAQAETHLNNLLESEPGVPSETVWYMADASSPISGRRAPRLSLRAEEAHRQCVGLPRTEGTDATEMPAERGRGAAAAEYCRRSPATRVHERARPRAIGRAPAKLSRQSPKERAEHGSQDDPRSLGAHDDLPGALCGPRNDLTGGPCDPSQLPPRGSLWATTPTSPGLPLSSLLPAAAPLLPHSCRSPCCPSAPCSPPPPTPPFVLPSADALRER